MTTRDAILERLNAVPALPVSVMEVIQLLQDPEADVGAVRRAVEHDPNLTANFLHLANSAYFGGRGGVATVQDALVRLGMKRIYQLVLATAISPLAQKPMKGYDLPAGEFLKHSVMTAVAAEELCRVLQLDGPDYLFTAGLVHDIGKAVLSTFVEVDVAPIIKLAFQESLPFHQAERQVLGIDHPEVGALLLHNWGIPEAIVQVVRWHHEPESMPGDGTAIDAVHLADHLARISGIGAGLDGLNYEPSREVVTRRGITTEVAESVVLRAVDAFQVLIDSFPKSK